MKRKNILYLGLDPSRFHHEGNLTHLPLIKTTPRPFDGEIKEAFRNVSAYTHVLFTSRTAVTFYREYSMKAGIEDKTVREKSYLCIGKATALLVREMGCCVQAVAEIETGEGVVTLLSKVIPPPGHLFFPRSGQGREVIPHYLEKSKIPFTLIDLYDTSPNPLPLPDLELFDEIIFTSPSTVEAFLALAGTLPPPEKCIALGPVTEKFLKSIS